MSLIEAMCREMCRADGADPDLFVMEINLVPFYGARGHLAQQEGRYVEAWNLYRPLAKAAISVINRAKLAED